MLCGKLISHSWSGRVASSEKFGIGRAPFGSEIVETLGTGLQSGFGIDGLLLNKQWSNSSCLSGSIIASLSLSFSSKGKYRIRKKTVR
jgi:hypothetical protein